MKSLTASCQTGVGKLLCSLVLTLYLPEVLRGTGTGILTCILPIFGKQMDLTTTEIGVTQSMISIGALLFTLPAGSIISKIGIPPSMHTSLFLLVGGSIIASVAPNLGVISIACLMFGISDCIWNITRHSWVTSVVDMENRGKVLSPLGGLVNFANFIGPIIGGLVSNYWETKYGFYLQVLLTSVTWIIVCIVPRVEPQEKEPVDDAEVDELRREIEKVSAGVEVGEESSAESSSEEIVLGSFEEDKTCATTTKERLKKYWESFVAVVLLQMRLIRENAWSLFTIGTFCCCLSIIRSARGLVIPMVALNIGVSSTQVGIVTSIAFGINTFFCAVGGYVIDNYGRRVAGITSVLLMGLSFVPLPFVLNMWGLVLTAVILGIGSSFSSGLILTMGADIAPKENRSEFLGIFRFAVNMGSVIGPLVLGLLMDHLPLIGACGFIVGTGIVGALWMFFVVKETLVKKDIITELEEEKEENSSSEIGSEESSEVDFSNLQESIQEREISLEQSTSDSSEI
eukprot:TRINITY_DN6909_c0_g1_i1.p1 TRINITY_DN6909_c0_g1~~TRINITY_DN6909_c0_g1_i1.p1  ORF type:complete len:514 (-),score=77.14 TRINITY_DN6909_c0_g1_i1:169-1710(-)